MYHGGMSLPAGVPKGKEMDRKAKEKRPPSPVPKEYSSFIAKNLTPLLDYWDMRDGVVFLADGSVEFGIEIYPQPDAYLSLDQKEEIADVFEAIFALLPEGARIRYYYEAQKATLDLVRDYLLTKRNTADVVQRMVKERAKSQIRAALSGARLRWSIKLAVHLPTVVTPSTGSLLKDLWIQIRQAISGQAQVKMIPFTPFYEKELDAILTKVENLRQAVLVQLQSAGLIASPMNNDAVVTTIYRWLNRDPQREISFKPLNEFYTKEELKRTKADPPTLRRQVAQTPLWATALDILYKKPFGFPPGEMEEHIAIYELTEPPTRAFWGAISEIVERVASASPSPMAIVIDIYKPPQNDLKLSLSRAFARKFREFRSGDTPEASAFTQEGVLFAALTRAEQGELFLRFSMSVVVRGDSKEDLEKQLKFFDGALSALPFGGKFRRLKENLFHPYRNLLPFMGKRQEMSFLVMSKAISRILANPGPWNREGEGAKPMVLASNRFAGITTIDLFEKRARSWNVVLVGTTGAGKTFTTQYLLSEALAEDPETEIIIVDKKGDYASWIELMGGNVIDVAPESGVTINMFDLDQTFFQERPVALPPDAKLGFLQKMFHVLLNKPNDPELALKEQLWLEAVRVAYNANTDVEYDAQGREVGFRVRPPTLSRIIDTIRSLDAIGHNALTSEQKVIARQLATELTSWTTGPLAPFLDGETNLRGENARLVYFNLSGIDRLEASLYMTLALALIAERIYGRLERSPRHVRKFIIFDEAHALFKIKEAAAMVVDLYRRARSYGAAVWTLTQTISEYRGAYTAGIIETTNIFMFVNSKGQGEAIHEVLGVPLAVGRAAERLRLEKGVYNELLYILYDQSGGIQGDVFRIYPTRWDYWLFTSHHEEVARRRAMVNQHGSLYRAIAKLANLDTSDDDIVELVKGGKTRAEEIVALLRQGGRR